MVEGVLWRAVLLFVINLSFSKEENYEVRAFPVREIPVKSTWNSVETYGGDDQIDYQGLPKHRPHVEYLPMYVTSKPRRKKQKKGKKRKRFEETTTKCAKRKKKAVKHKKNKANKVKKKAKTVVDKKRQPFDITVHIKMDEN